ncbi:hypothetical protein [Vibrio sp. WXL103]|uniref:hypothetical protein n=1 Tax=Vibrio sp. WXL103 TaxID=3450710 RepID=UPI003EC6FF85
MITLAKVIKLAMMSLIIALVCAHSAAKDSSEVVLEELAETMAEPKEIYPIDSGFGPEGDLSEIDIWKTPPQQDPHGFGPSCQYSCHDPI